MPRRRSRGGIRLVFLWAYPAPLPVPCPGELYRIQSADPLPVTLPHWIQSGGSCRARGADRLDPCRDPSEGMNQIHTPGCCERGSPHPPTRSQQPHSGTGQQPTAKELTTTARAHRAAHGLTGAQQSTTGTAATTATRELNIDQLNFQPSEFRTAPAAIPADSLTGDQIQSDSSGTGSGRYGGRYPLYTPFRTTTASHLKFSLGIPIKVLGDIDKARKIGYNGYRIPIPY